MPNEFAGQEGAAPSDITQSLVKEGSPATNPPQWLTKGVWGIGLASFLADVGHDSPYRLVRQSRDHPASSPCCGPWSDLLAYLGFAVPTPNVFMLAGLAIGCIETSEHAAAVLAPTDLRGSAFGLLATVQSFGNIVASSIAGLLWSLVSPTAFLYLAAWALVSCVVLTRVTVASRPPRTGER